MSIKTKMNVVTRLMGRTGLKLRASSPTILTVAGVGSLIAAGVLAARATPKLEPVIDGLEEDLGVINIATGLEMSEDQKTRNRVTAYVDFGRGVLKVYGPSVALGAIGTVSILYSHGLMRKRNAALVAAYGVLERAFDSYRDRVRETFGEDVDEQLSRGRRLKVTDVDPKNKKFEVSPVEDPEYKGRSDYAVEFKEGNPNWNSFRPEMNLFFLRAQEKFANHTLNVRGHVLLNDIYDGMGIPRTPAGCVVGWVRDGEDGYIDFGLPEHNSPEEQDYIYYFNGESPLLLDFNVDGLVYNLLG